VGGCHRDNRYRPFLPVVLRSGRATLEITPQATRALAQAWVAPMNEQELREIAKATLAGLDRLQIRGDLSESEVRQTYDALTRTRAYWHQLAYPEQYKRPSWFAKVRRWLMAGWMDWRRYPFN
jgi:hypothetical protein